MTEDTHEKVRHNPAENRFEIDTEGQIAVADYVMRDDAIHFTHTEVPEHLRNQGLGLALAKAALDHAREESLRVVPHCRFIDAYIRRHPEYQDLVDAPE